MLGLRKHLDACAACLREYASLRHTQQLLMSVGRPKAPADLGLKLRLAISREAAETRRPFEGLRVRLENTLQNAFMVPATAGLLVRC
jgi:anti-sigma factor RsiW